MDAEPFLAEAVHSVFSQSYGAWELLLVDDGSTDGSTELAQEWATRCAQVRYLEHPGHANRGMSASRNLGMREARGKYIALLDADDVWYPHKLAQQVRLLEAHPAAALVFGRYEYWHSWQEARSEGHRDHVVKLAFPADRVYEPPVLATLCAPLGDCSIPSTSNVMFRRAMLDRTGGYEDAFTGMYEDRVFLMKVFLNERVYVADETWDRYRQHPTSHFQVKLNEGQFHPTRLTFLRWLERYLDGHCRDPEVRRLFDKAVDPYSEYTHPVLHRLSPMAHRALAVIRSRGGAAAPVAAAASTGTYEGYLDICDCMVIQGWVRDTSDPGRVVAVDLLDGNRLLTTVVADQYRLDLEMAGKGTGRHGFISALPRHLRDGRPHWIRARVSGTESELGGSPKLLLCELPIVTDLKVLLERLQSRQPSRAGGR